ncbi:protein eva-1 homolog C [Anguilla anguilla]|uniref:protein eva-1 homolog C n=1 Tax=Anguilla anguilla TaxID=7936 RepID=UPI0015B35C02|nr:protein eva-1 homolog C [Anguilla anguilla]
MLLCFSSPRQRWRLIDIFYYILLLWTKEMDGLANFSNYLTRIIQSHAAHACDGERMRLHCPRHSTISVLSAFYGLSETEHCGPATGVREPSDRTCSSFTALQKLLAECQGHRDCQLLVNKQVFGRDPCPGTSKYLHVSYKCKPTEHRKKVGCQGEHVKLRCKYPRVLNIYAAAYGRAMEDEEYCPSDDKEPPPFECLFHGAVDVVTKACYAKPRCVIAVNDQNFRDPCFPGIRKYLTILFACVPQTLLREADPNAFSVPGPTSVPKRSNDSGVPPYPKGSRLPDKRRFILSNSLTAYGYIKEHPEMAALLFVSSTCVGLICTLLAVSVRLSCRQASGGGARRKAPPKKGAGRREEEGAGRREEEEATAGESEASASSVSAGDRKGSFGWEATPQTLEAADLAERIERREQVIQEIWMNAYLNGTPAGPR